jgi:hypothetical protein
MFYEDRLTVNLLNHNLKEHERLLFKNKLYKTPNKYLCGRELSKNQNHIIEYLWIAKCGRIDDEKYHSTFTTNFCDDCKIGKMQSRFMKCKYVDFTDRNGVSIRCIRVQSYISRWMHQPLVQNKGKLSLLQKRLFGFLGLTISR